MTDHVLHRWLSSQTEAVGQHKLLVLSEVDGGRPACLDDLRSAVREHYVSAETLAKRLAALGAPKTAKLLREQLPTGKKARSGDLGEILATEVAEQHLQYQVPIRRLRWKDGREMALRGDDIIGIVRGKNGKLRFLKGESKSRAALSTVAITEAAVALDKDAGRPSRHSVLFVAARLRDQGKDDLALELEDAVLQSFRSTPVEHLLFAFCGNKAQQLLKTHLTSASSTALRRHAVAVYLDDHGQFIKTIYEGL
jgi:hypothetical protein